MSTAFSTKCEGRNAVHFENADLPIDAVDDSDDDSDDGNNGDFEELADEPFVPVARGRSSNPSRSVSPSTSRSSISSVSLMPPTPTSNVFEPLTESEDVPAREASVSWDFRQQFYGVIATSSGGPTDVESVTDRIYREIDEARTKFSHIVLPTAVTHDLRGQEVVCKHHVFNSGIK